MLSLIKMVSRVTVVVLMAFILRIFGQPALAQIAPGVTQSAARTANITGTIMQSDGSPVVGTDVKLNGPVLLSTKSDAHGIFSFSSVPWGIYQIVVTSTLGTVSRNGVPVNGDINVAIQYQTQSGLRTIAHVSTIGAGAHINVTSSSITSISPSEYAFQGNGTWAQLFAQIPGVAVSGYTEGGYVGGSALPGSPQAPVVLSLNGALPYETSTTLDGMPLQGTSSNEGYTDTGGGVDLSNMPLNAFDTADIVRGPGANAPSIVDSVGGSFVLHAPGKVDINHFEFSTSNDPYGGIVSNAKIALHFGRLSATFIYGVNDSPGPLGTSNVISAIPLTPTTINGQTVWASTYSSPYITQGIPNCYCSVTDTLLYCCVPQSTAWTAHSGAAALFYEITPSISAEVFYAGSTSRVNTQGGYYPVEFAPSMAVPSYSGSLTPSPSGQTTYLLQGVNWPNLNTQASSLSEEKLTAYIGRGVLRLAALQYSSFYYVNAYQSLGNGQYTLWGTSDIGPTYPGTPTAYNGTPESLTFPNVLLDYHLRSNNRDLLGSYAVPLGATSSIGVSYVTSYYNDPYTINFVCGGIPTFSQSNPSSLSETTNETRVHVETEISDKLSLGLSWYFAKGTYHVPVPSNPSYWTNSVFPYNAPRFGAVWKASPDIAVRTAIGGGYALPVLFNLTGFSLNFANGAYSEYTPNLNLKPEETFGFDVGTDIRFHRNTLLSLDLYRTNLYGQFYTLENESTLNGFPLFLTQTGNLGTTRYEGINLDIRHNVPAGLYWHGTLGFTRGYVVSVPPGFYNNPSVPCVNCANQFVIPGPNFNGAYSAAVPYANASAQLGYHWSPGKYFDLSSTYYGNNNQYFSSKAFVEFDAHAGYKITRNVSLLATFRNITGVYDQSIQVYNASYAIPVIQGAPPYAQGAALEVPYGPRSVIVIADVLL